MKMSCDIIQDLLPLYIDGTVSAAGNRLVKEHLKSCPYCAAYQKMIADEFLIQTEDPLEKDDRTYEENYLYLAKRIRKRRILSASFIAAAGIVSAVALTATLFYSKKDH